MVNRGTRVKTKKFRKTPSGKNVKHYSRDKKTKAVCAVTRDILPGMGNQTKNDSRKPSKSQRRPSVKFGGVLSSKARREVWENYALIKNGKKELTDVTERVRKFITPQIEKATNGSKDPVKQGQSHPSAAGTRTDETVEVSK